MSGLTAIADDLWSWDDAIRMPGGVVLPTRSPIVRLAGGDLVVISPAKLDDAGWAEIDALGRVRHLVGPNCFHHLYLGRAAERYPEATVYVAPGLPEKRPTLRVDRVLGDEAPGSWGEALQPFAIRGIPKVNEIVLLHRPSGSLLVTDLFFHLVDVSGWRSRMVFRMMGTLDRFAVSRFTKLLTRDRAARDASLDRVLAADFERVVPAHGTVLEEDARARARAAFGRAP